MIPESSYKSLHQAAKNGHLPLVDKLLNVGYHINAVDTDGYTALFYAVQCERRDIIELLLKNGADINIRNTLTGIAPIHYLAVTGKVNLMAFLFEIKRYTIDLSMRDKGVEGMLAIHLASKFGHAEVVRMLLTWTQNLHKDFVSGSGKTPLMYAAQYNQLPVIRVLAEHSADINYTSTKNEGHTALHYAVMSGNEEVVTELLNMGAHMCPSNLSSKMSPVHYAALYGYLNILNLLHEHGCNLDLPVRDEEGNLPIHLAAMRDHENIIRWIQETEGFSLFAWNNLGYTPLHLATSAHSLNVMKYIIDTAGIHVDMTTYDGFRHTALHLASSSGDNSIVSYLIDRKADVNRMSAENRYTPLHYATMKNFPKSIELLYQAGGNVHVHYNNEDGTVGGEPLLITAAKYKAYDAAKLLLSGKLGVYPDYQDNDGFTALYYAVDFGNVQLINLLLSKGANVNHQDKWKQTPLHCAVHKGDISILKELLRVSPCLSVADINGVNAVHLAALLGNLPCLQMLLTDIAYFYVKTSNATQDLLIHLAAYGGNINVLKWIIERGMCFDTPNGMGKTALDIAIERENEEVIYLLQNIGVNEKGYEEPDI
jgi:serine/threonine-protein phosphatase 6 regulatory ankyrin repeat subunit B